jgi:hypothetical protein
MTLLAIARKQRGAAKSIVNVTFRLLLGPSWQHCFPLSFRALQPYLRCQDCVLRHTLSFKKNSEVVHSLHGTFGGSLHEPLNIVLDPFLGSGSTLIACEKTGRHCRGLELDPLYVEIILRRYEALTKQPAILESTGETFAEMAVRRQREV